MKRFKLTLQSKFNQKVVIMKLAFNHAAAPLVRSAPGVMRGELFNLALR